MSIYNTCIIPECIFTERMRRPRRLYLSTSCLSESCLAKAVESTARCGGVGMELGHFTGKTDDWETIPALAKEYGLNLLVHNYFPPPIRHFVLNLADPDPINRLHSLLFTQKAVRWCGRNGIPFYSVHAGFACSIKLQHLGKNFAELPFCSLEEAQEHFYDSLRKLCLTGQEYGVNIAFENNVCMADNAPGGNNRHLLCADPEDIVNTLHCVRESNLKLLLDIGHLKISAVTLGFNVKKAIRYLGNYVAAVHLHDNDGKVDRHELPELDSHLMQILLHNVMPNVPIVLEVKPCIASEVTKWWMSQEKSVKGIL